ncbi:MAG: SpvB/TcaC N-terminal domain-containing protein, partial [Myxococcota bacterium]
MQLPPIGGNSVPATVGSIGGALSVDNNGDAAYSVPFALPPGRRGMAPAIGLSYSSAGTNGIAGVGWRLEGLSFADTSCEGGDVAVCIDGVKLYRGAANGSLEYHNDDLAPDPEAGVDPSFAAIEDAAFFLADPSDGSRTYALERTIGNTTCNDYKVVHPDGNEAYYSCIDEEAGVPYGGTQLPLVRSTDAYGNYVAYEWMALGEDNDVLLPKRIGYTGNSEHDLSPTKWVVFEYEEERPDSVHYRGTDRLSQRLSAVRIESDFAENHREYQLSYEEASGLSLLESGAECVAGSGGGAGGEAAGRGGGGGGGG